MAIKTVIIKPGESYALKSGASVLSAAASGNATISNTCDLVIPTESFVCYGFVLIAHESTDSGTEAFEDDHIQFLGVSLNGVKYPFPNPVDYNFGSSGEQLSVALKALPLTKDILIGYCASSSNNTGRDSYKYYVMFKTVPSIGDNLQLMAAAKSPNASSSNSPVIATTYYNIPCQTREDILNNGNGNVCNCT